MAIIIGAVSQKGGVGKSTIARLVAREFAAQDWAVKIADLDIRDYQDLYKQPRHPALGLSRTICRIGSLALAIWCC